MYRLYGTELLYLGAASADELLEEVFQEQREAQGIAGLGYLGGGTKHKMQQDWCRKFWKKGDMREILGILEAADIWLKEYKSARKEYAKEIAEVKAAKIPGLSSLGIDIDFKTTGMSVAKGILPSIPVVGPIASIGFKVSSLVKGISARKKAKTALKNAKRVKSRIKSRMSGMTKRVEKLADQMERLGIPALPKASGKYWRNMKDDALRAVGKLGKDKDMTYWHRLKGVGRYAERQARELATISVKDAKLLGAAVELRKQRAAGKAPPAPPKIAPKPVSPGQRVVEKTVPVYVEKMIPASPSTPAVPLTKEVAEPKKASAAWLAIPAAILALKLL